MTGLLSARSLMQACGLPRLEARMLMEHVVGRPRSWLLAHDTDPLADDVPARFQALVQRRLAGEPMAYLVGHREFMGHRFRVSPGVLIPRPDTELLVETALAHVRARRAVASDVSGRCDDGRQGQGQGHGDDAMQSQDQGHGDDATSGHGERHGRDAATAPCIVLDMGCGSGAIAISLALAQGATVQVTALDVSEQALAIARENARALGARVRFVQSDWFEALTPEDRFDLILSNPPYIAADDPHLSQGDLRYEPVDALTDGADGLSDIRQLVTQARHRLNPGGAIWLEHGWKQADAVRELLQHAGFRHVASLRDLAGIERISGGYL